MVFRLILPEWRKAEVPSLSKVLEGEFTEDELKTHNANGYNVYFLPNSPSHYEPGTTVDGSHIDQFDYVYVDMDLKDGVYANKEDFLAFLLDFPLEPTFIVDSGNGIHAYWSVSDLDAMSFLRLQRRLCRKFQTDEAVSKIYQLMRVPGYQNTKVKDSGKLCENIFTGGKSYTCEELDSKLPTISHSDEAYCKQHYNKTYRLDEPVTVDDKIPPKFCELLRNNKEVKEIWAGNVDDRSKGDYRLGHIMFAHGLTKDEAMSVLVNSAKALARAPAHRVSYAQGIIEKIWTYNINGQQEEFALLSSSVEDILARSGDGIKGTRFPCWRYLDDTNHGFRLGQVIGLVAGVGVGKTAVALNMFMGFVKNNFEYDHFFVPLEQPKEEIADRWKEMCGSDTHLHSKVQILSNYADDGSYRNLSLSEIKDYILKYQKVTGRKVGSIVIDHIAVLKKKTKDGENQGLMEICHEMKAFAIQTNTMLIMQSQAPREKAGIGDLELNKDAAYGTLFFEAYCDYLVTVWQPLKRSYRNMSCPTVTAYKFCKIRHKKQGLDVLQEDVPYVLYFDPKTQRLREMTELEQKSFDFFNQECVNKRKQDRKTELVTYVSVKETNGKLDNHQDSA